MEQCLLCGEIARNPLYIKELGINIYTAEELCYYIYNNPILIDEGFINDRLVDFFRNEIDMPELAGKIIKYYDSSSDMDSVLVIIMRDIGYYNDNQIARFQDRLLQFKKKNISEKLRERGDLLFNKKRYECAVNAYSKILELKRDTKLDIEFYARVLQHMGLAYLKMGYADEAIECLQAAYAEVKDELFLEQMYYIAIEKDRPFARELETISSSQISAWHNNFEAIMELSRKEAESSDIVRKFSGNENNDRAQLNSFIADEKNKFCHMATND